MTLSGLAGGTTYFFAVSPMDTYGVENILSAEASVAVPVPAPLVLQAQGRSRNSRDVELSWNPSPDSDVYGYTVYYGTQSGIYSNSATFYLILEAVTGCLPAFSATTWWVATNGIDTNTGTSNRPFATVMRAQTAAASGDTVYLRGGTYFLKNTNITATNGTHVNMLCSTNNSSSAYDVPGFNHVLNNNLGYKGTTEVANLDNSKCDVTFNFFTLPVTVATNDFLTLDESLLTVPRQADGSLPCVNFLRLTNTSDCINIGTNLGFPFYGAAPDLGAFESGPTNAPNPVIAKSGTNLIFTASSWANQTNCLLGTTNLVLAPSQWTVFATNKSDLAGNCRFTNPIPVGLASRFYRISLP